MAKVKRGISSSGEGKGFFTAVSHSNVDMGKLQK